MTVTFAILRGFLEQLGFRTRVVPGSLVAFKHAGSGALVVLRVYQDDEAVSPSDLALTRRILDEFGVLPREEFETALRESVLAG